VSVSAPYEDLLVETRAGWRAWLAEHHEDATGVWVVTWRKGEGPTVSYDDLVEEALCFGWIDSRGGRREGGRTALLMTPRRARSAWSALNKQRVARLSSAGLMHASGEAVVAAARESGTWTALDSVERLEVPDDLAQALSGLPPARDHWDAFPRSVRRAILEWVTGARRPETRARRVEETARLARQNLRAHQWPRHG
jgi:uncharacterized protein YdeI (YjbR/CyaY-like superfamily)